MTNVFGPAKRQIVDINAREVSLVDVPAILHPFVVIKAQAEY